MLRTALLAISLAASVASATRGAPADEVTFHEVRPNLERRCQSCHRAGGVAPMALGTYVETRPWAKAIARQVSDGNMPPWFAEAGVGRFRNDPSLSPEELRTLLRWVERGAPEGAPLSVEPESAVVESSEWEIGDPDLVVQMPRAFDVPAAGVVDYIYVRVPLEHQGERWLRAIEVRPTERSVVHHVDVFACATGCYASLEPGLPSFLPQDATAPRSAPDDRGEVFGIGEELLYSFLPGGDPWVLPEGRARLLPAGTELLLNIHYQPSGEAVSDRTRVGLRFASAPPAQRVITIGVDNASLWIPAGARDHRVLARFVLRQGMELLALTPHMHYRGRAYEFTAVHPSGSREDLLRVPRYDFRWQLTYVLDPPKPLAAGTEIVCTATFDNSSGNPYNPDPGRDVPWGRQTSDEMMTAWVEVAVPVDADIRTLFAEAPSVAPAP